MISGYTSLLTSNDGAGNLALVDALKGYVLLTKMNKAPRPGIPSLQVAVIAAGGSTRTDAFFLVNFFWVPAPEFNSGVIATFELRGTVNELIQSGARTAFYDYNKKWMGSKFKPGEIKDADACGADTFCAEGKKTRHRSSEEAAKQRKKWDDAYE
jgi:hypothetical protein